jgi:hypothetical protein
LIDGRSLAAFAAREIGAIVLVFLAIGLILGFTGAFLFSLIF